MDDEGRQWASLISLGGELNLEEEYVMYIFKIF